MTRKKLDQKLRCADARAARFPLLSRLAQVGRASLYRPLRDDQRTRGPRDDVQ